MGALHFDEYYKMMAAREANLSQENSVTPVQTVTEFIPFVPETTDPPVIINKELLKGKKYAKKSSNKVV